MSDSIIAIATSVVGSGGVSEISFTSIPQTYTHLLLKTSLRGTGVGETNDAVISFNSSTSNFNNIYLYGSGSGTVGSGISGGTAYIGFYTGSGETASTFASGEVYVFNYASAKYKPVIYDAVGENRASASAYSELGITMWSNSSAVTSLSIKPANNLWAEHSSVTLYGLKNS